MPTSKWEMVEPKDFIGRTIVGIEKEGVNSFTLVFSDNTKITLDVEHVGNGLHGIALYQQVEDEQGEMFPEYIQEMFIP